MCHRFIGLRDYPLCQNGAWVDGVSTALPFLDAGAVHGSHWLPEREPTTSADASVATGADAPVQLVGRGTAVWSPAMCVPNFQCLAASVHSA